MEGQFKKRYGSLAELIYDKEPDPSFVARAGERGVTQERLKTMVETLQGIERNKNIVPTLAEFKRVMVGKLTVPVSFLRHVELLAKFANVSEEAIWQLLMIETCQLYADKYAGVVDVLNEVVSNDAG